MELRIGSQIRKTGIVLGMLLALITGGAASASPVLAQQPTAASNPSFAVTCGGGWPPRNSYEYHSSYDSPNACLKCTAAGAIYEATGKWLAYCWKVYSGGQIAWVDLYLFCVACRSADADGNDLLSG